MTVFKENLKDFFEDEREKIATKIEKTPMEKFFVIFLVIIIVSTVILTYFQFKSDLESPFYSIQIVEKGGAYRLKYNINNVNATSVPTEDAKLKNQDSDLDGLNDYDEINMYNTSPHLEDSDGDGVWDKQEIMAGTDPNCPTGQQCTNIAPASDTTTQPTLNLPTSTTDLSALGLDIGMEDLANVQEKLLSGEMTLQDLGINDPQLEAQLEQIKNTPTTDMNVTGDEKTQAVDTLRNMTPAELRAELINRGADKAALDKIDDATLQKNFLQALEIYQ